MPIRNVRDAMREMRHGSRRIRTRDQAIAVGLKNERQSRRDKRARREGRKSSR